MDARILTVFVFSTWNTFVDIIFDADGVDPPLLWAMLIWRVGVLLAWGYQSKSSSSNTKLLTYATAVPICFNAVYWFSKMPFTWESNLWAAQVDTALTLWLVLTASSSGDNSSSSTSSWLDALSQTIQDMFAAYYTASGVWKVNSHFLDPTGSCATVFLAQHVGQTIGALGLPYTTAVDVAAAMKPTGPVGTLVVEFAMGALLVTGRYYQSRRLTRIGLIFVLFFHLAVCLTPAPHNISLFALQCAARLAVLCEPASLVAAGRRVRPFTAPLLAAAVAVAAYGMQNSFTPLNWAGAFYAPTMAFQILAIVIEGDTEAKTGKQAASSTTTTRPWWMYVFVVWAWFYAYGGLMLGLQEEETPNMFSNLKVHGGSNHWFLPTGLLFHWYGAAGDAHPYGGGVVRIEETDSRWFYITYPADLTHILTPEPVADILQDIGNPRPSYFNPGANRVLGLMDRGWVPGPASLVLQYTVPALELKRLLSEAKEKDRDFTLVYAQLPGTKGDEEWRAHAVERRVTVKVRDGQVAQCHVQQGGRGKKTPCAATDLPMIDYEKNVPWWIRHTSLYHAYPIIKDYGPDRNQVRPTITCFGP
jgi:hypothetical protein